MTTHKALVLHQYGKQLKLEELPIPEPKDGQLLVKVQASTVNPSDRGTIAGGYGVVILPAIMGIQGTGRVVKAIGANLQHWIGKRISFISEGSGTWGQYSITSPLKAFPIDEDVPIHVAASGIVNPLTVIGFTHIYEHNEYKKGIIHTAAASALGRMLNKRCQTLGIPLLNIVRRQQHAQLLKSEGAKHVIVTNGQWEKEYAAAIKEHGFNVLFDCLGGGPVTQTLVSGLNADSYAYLYGYLEQKPFTLKYGYHLSKGITVTGFMLFSWLVKISAEKLQQIKNSYSQLLKSDLSTNSYKILKLSEIEEALQLAVSKATEGKITIVPV